MTYRRTCCVAACRCLLKQNYCRLNPGEEINQGEFKRRQYPKTERQLKSCISTGNAEDQAAGFSLWGNIRNDKGDKEGALAMYERAAGDPCRFAEPCADWGTVLSDLGHDAEAIRKFEQAVKLDPKDRSPWTHTIQRPVIPWAIS